MVEIFMNEKLENLSILWAKNRDQARPLSKNLVYSTESVGTQAGNKTTSPSKFTAPVTNDLPNSTSNAVRVHRETKGRGGKAVTVITGVALADTQLIALGKDLKTQCGSGGTVKDGVIEIQGDHVDRIVLTLVAKGFKAKRAGG